MRIAMLGTRGIPASYSGFETCVEQLGARLVERGHEVIVYCRSHHISYPEPTYRGIRLVRLPTMKNKYLETIVHSFVSAAHVAVRRVDLVLMFIAGNSPVAAIPRLAREKVVLNVDGLDWKREKWPPLAKRYIQFAEFLATRLPDAIVTDSRVVQDYYRRRHGAESVYIPYGSELTKRQPGPVLERFGLAERHYILFVGRLVPENCAHHLIHAFERLDTDMRCVIVGDAPYAEEYIRSLHATSDPRVIFMGYQFGEAYEELASNAYLFAETSGVGGTHPALVEAMGLGTCPVVHDTPENLETMGDSGFAYDGTRGGESLAGVLETLIGSHDRVESCRHRARERARSHFSWEAVTDSYEQLFRDVLDGA